MYEALAIGATGMQAQQLHVETIANNLVNMTTPGYKKARVGFTDLVVQEASRVLPPAGDGDTGVLGTLPRLGAGIGVTGVTRLFDIGDLKRTGSPYDIAIQGEGFLEVTLPDGGRAYTRGGTLKVNKDGQLATQSGYPLKPGIAIPDNAQSLIINSDGRVQVTQGKDGKAVDVGQLEIVRFTNPQGLIAQGDQLYRSSDASGEALATRVGEDGTGALAQGVLEASNVKMVDEMVNLMLAQRAYEASVKVVQAADEMLGMTNGLRR